MTRSMVVVNRRAWVCRADLLARLLQAQVPGPIGSPDGSASMPDDLMTVIDPDYWSDHLPELTDAMRDCLPRRGMSESPMGVGFASGTTERLTLSVEEAAVALGISRASAYEAVHRGEIPHIKIGKRMLVPRASLARLLAAADHGDGPRPARAS